MNFDGRPCKREEYPADYYREFLEYVQKTYDWKYWDDLPREVAAFWDSARPQAMPAENDPSYAAPGSKVKIQQTGHDALGKAEIKIWIDLDNTPHVPFFSPIIRELKNRGYLVVITARDAFQVCELADKMKLEYRRVGRHYGKNKFKKIWGLAWRSFQLAPFAIRHKPRIALSHGARSQILISNVLRIPNVMIMDYEHARMIAPAKPRWMIVPEALSGEKLSAKAHRVLYYRGIKEDVYAPEFEPDPSVVEELGLSQGEIIVTVRPPANEAHYYTPKSDDLLFELMNRIGQTAGVRAILLPRNRGQEQAFKQDHPEWFEKDKTIVPDKVFCGLDLLWASDLVVSGGGTMNREAAALGVPVYSIFRGTTGAVDRMLQREGKLVMIQDSHEIWTKIHLVPRKRDQVPSNDPRSALSDIVDHIERIIHIEQFGRLPQGTSNGGLEP